MYLILDMDSGLLEFVSPPESLHIMAAITSRPTIAGASRCLQLEDTQKINVKCAYFDTEDHNCMDDTGGVRHRIFMVIRT